MLDVPPLWYKSKKSRYFQQIAPLTSGNVNHSTTEWHYGAAQGRSLYTTVNSYNARSPAIDECVMYSELQGLENLLNLFQLLNCHKELCQTDDIHQISPI